MNVMIELTHDEAQNDLCYALICETMEGSRWNSGRRRRLFSQTSDGPAKKAVLFD